MSIDSDPLAHLHMTMEFLVQPTQILFFTGKGGVGKTSVASSTAVQLAEAGRRVLLVSTDPASNLDEVFAFTFGINPTQYPALPTLYGMNLDPVKAASEYRERMVAPYRGLLPEAALKSIEEQLSGSCTVEIAAFDEFTKLLAAPEVSNRFDHIIFDTAPTGHTLRLLSLPSAWNGFINQSTTGVSCLGPLAGLQNQQKLYQESARVLTDATRTTFVIVARAETSTLKEAARTSHELKELGASNQHLVINGIFRAIDSGDRYASEFERRGRAALESLPSELVSISKSTIPFYPTGIIGIKALQSFGKRVDSAAESDSKSNEDLFQWPLLASLVKELTAPGHGVILAMGKGGVGKTTVASAIAVEIAKQGYSVHLSTTDPAAHLATTLNNEGLAHLTVSCIDPRIETKRYADEVLSTTGQQLDAHGRALLEEDLRSPCTEEIAVFRAFAEAVSKGAGQFVVLDTAPTGHTILLLDSALAHHREVSRQTKQIPSAVSSLLGRLRDPNFTRVMIVTLAEATPVHEAASLQLDLRRAGIEPFAWVVNQVLGPLKVSDPQLAQRKISELKFMREVKSLSTGRFVVIPWQWDPPVGIQKLAQLAHKEHFDTDD